MNIYANEFNGIFVLLLIAVSILPQAHQEGSIANQYFLEKEKFLIEILHHVEQPLLNREWLGIAKNLILNQTNYFDFNQIMRDFQASYEKGSLLFKHEVFNIYDPVQYQQAYGLFYFFFNTNDWETLLLNACWARSYINPGMFVFALMQALMKRCDIKGLILPEIYEIMPQLFLKESTVHTALRFDYGQYSRTEFLYKANKQYKRQKDEIYLKRNHHERQYGNQSYTQTPKFFLDLTKLVLPAENSAIYPNDQTNLDYLTHDIDWNAHWYNQNMGLWWNEVNSDEVNVLEIWFGLLQQVLARYKLECYSTKRSVEAKVSPRLLYINGRKFYENENSNDVTLMQITAQVQQIINEQKLDLRNAKMDLAHGRNWNLLLKEIFGKNLNDVHKRFFGAGFKKSKLPNLSLFFETQLRDAKFYEAAQILLQNYQLLRANFQSYSLSAWKPSNVTITNVVVSRLQTSFESFHFDASNLLPSQHFYFDGNLIWHKSLQAHQHRLQHKPFTISLNITAATPQAVIVRSYLAPPQTSRLIDPSAFFQLDAVVVDLIAGANLVQRKSTEFFFTPERIKLDLSILYRLTMLGLDGQYDFPLNVTTAKCGFPQHLLLPRGDLSHGGLPVQFFFIVTPYLYRSNGASSFDCDYSNGVIRLDDLPLAFPFDYDREELESWSEQNVYWLRENIFH